MRWVLHCKVPLISKCETLDKKKPETTIYVMRELDVQVTSDVVEKRCFTSLRGKVFLEKLELIE